jgi:hypothetical protein
MLGTCYMHAVHMRDNGYRRRLRRWKCISLRIQNSPIILMVRYVECRRGTKGDSGRYSCHHDKQTLATVVSYLVCVFEHREVSTLVRHHSNVTLYDNQAGGELCPAAGHVSSTFSTPTLPARSFRPAAWILLVWGECDLSLISNLYVRTSGKASQK